jgi:peptidoglycan/LPS O-acetylase OafA/YrhL
MSAREHARFTALDGMRGVAAIAVVLFHIGRAFGTDLFPKGYLAVDLFFALSGFVLSYSYDRRFAAGMKASTFFRLRVIRLMPLYWLGWMLGAIVLIASPTTAGMHGDLTVMHRFVAAFLNFFLLPYPIKGEFNDLFPLDGPGWSLFYELFFANIIFALGWKVLRGKKLALFILVSVVWLAAGVRLHRGIDFGSLIDLYQYAPARVLASFFIGVAVHRGHLRTKLPRVPAWVVMVLVLGSFCVQLDGPVGILFDMFCVLVGYPVMIALGAVAKEKNPRAGALLGDTSYALYATHYPVLCAVASLIKNAGVIWHAAYALPLAAALFGMGFLFHQYFDGPARAQLARL